MLKRSIIYSILATAALSLGCARKPETPSHPITFTSCLSDLTNTLRLATGPSGTMVMSSSYDTTGGNDDYRNFHGKHRDGSLILAKWDGPGCVRRIWMTGQRDDQEIQFFLDGEATPSLRCRIKELKRGAKLPFTKPVCDHPSSALISYVPIPFSKSLVISAFPTEKKSFYYQINAELFPEGTLVNTLSLPLSREESDRLEAIHKAWMPPVAAPPDPLLFELKPTSGVTLLDVAGPAIIKSMSVTPHWPDNLTVKERNRLLRTTELRIYWDGRRSPSVLVPLGDFFLNGRDLRQHHALLFANKNGTWTSRLPMPYRKGARIELFNQSSLPFSVKASFTIEPLSAWDKQLNYLHATWNHANTPGRPLDILKVKGSGHLAGCYLAVLATDGQWNILEGDERIFIDCEKQPSFHGTGLEDYFNGGWYYDTAFNHPFGGALEDGAIKTTQYRLHQPDPVSFNKSISMDIEFGHGNTSKGHMASTAYYYLTKPDTAPFELPSHNRRSSHIPDPYRRVAVMCSLLEAERQADLNLARDICIDYVERYRQGADVELMRLRLLGYGKHSPDAVRTLRKECKTPEAKHQANILLAFHDNPEKGLLTTHINGDYELYLDGKQVLSGNSLTKADTLLVDLTKGQHVLAVKVKWTRPDNWITVNLRGHSGEWFSDTSWKCSNTPTPGWEQLSYNDLDWQECRDRGLLPKMSWFSFFPNAFPFTQQRRLTGPAKGLDVPGQTTSFFRKTITVK